MKKILTIFFFLIFTKSFSQINDKDISQKAFNFRVIKNQPDSALKYYLILEKSFTKFQEMETLFEIGSCYLELDKDKNAEYYFLKCLEIEKKLDRSGYIQSWSCEKLSDIYLKMGEYRKALIFDNYIKTKYKPIRHECFSSFINPIKLKKAYQKSFCYEKLNLVDSAIINLAPYIFVPELEFGFNEFERNNMYSKQSEFYIKLLERKYCKEEILIEFKEGVKNLFFEQVIKIDSIKKTKSIATNSYFKLFNIKTYLSGNSTTYIKMDQETPNYLKKEYFIKNIESSLIAKLILNEKL